MLKIGVVDDLNRERYRIADRLTDQLFKTSEMLAKSKDGLLLGEEQVEQVTAHAAMIFAVTMLIPDHMSKQQFLQECKRLVGTILDEEA